MMKFSDKALKLIGEKLLSSMEASSKQDSSTSTPDNPPANGTLAAHERARSLTLRAEIAGPQKARVLLFRNNTKDDP